MKKFFLAMFLSAGALAANSGLDARSAGAETPAAEPVGSCVWECGSAGTIYQKPSLCNAACPEPCEPICW